MVEMRPPSLKLGLEKSTGGRESRGGAQRWHLSSAKTQAWKGIWRMKTVLVLLIGMSLFSLGSAHEDHSVEGKGETLQVQDLGARRNIRWSWQKSFTESVMAMFRGGAEELKKNPEEVKMYGGDQHQAARAGRSRLPVANQQVDQKILAIFTAPKPFEGQENDVQRRALHSWLQLNASPHVVLLGNHPSFYAVAADFGDQVSVDSRIDCNYRGVPLFNSILARAQATDYQYSMIISPDVIILSSIAGALNTAKRRLSNFVIMAAQTDIAQIPTGLVQKLNYKLKRRIRSYLQKHGKKGLDQKVGLWLWNNSPLPLHNATMPPFSYQRGKHDRWLAHEVVAAGYRDLVDVSDVVTCVKIQLAPARDRANPGGAQGRGSEESAAEGETSGNSTSVFAYTLPTTPGEDGKRKNESALIQLRKWSSPRPDPGELMTNRQLAEVYVSEALERTRPLPGKVWRLSRCREGKICAASANCTFQQSDARGDFSYHPSQDPADSQWVCSHAALHVPAQGAKPLHVSEPPTPVYNTVEELLPFVANERKIVTLVAVSGLYKDMLMTFVCMVRRLELPNVLVAALDPDLYEFAVEQGLAVFYDEYAQQIHLENAHNSTECEFGTVCFTRVTKCKSRVALTVLRLGYSVLYSDVDIVWFRDPLPELEAYGPGLLPIQSDMPEESQPPNGARGTSHPGGALNSGLYFARAEPQVIAAFEAIVAHAQKSWMSEQPSFFKILCGSNGTNTVGDDECIWPENGLRTVVLPRRLHPNGRIYNYWNEPDTAKACISHGCATLHSNWVQGHDNKLSRLKGKGFWYYDAKNRICVQEWYGAAQGL